MILWWLRVFRCQILTDLATSETEKAMLQDRLELVEREKSRLWEQNQDLIDRLARYFEMDKNLEWQGRGAPCPFPEAPHLPESMVHAPDNSPLPPSRSQGQQIVDARWRDFKKQTAIKFGIELPQ